jgi:hypothetical protein
LQVEKNIKLKEEKKSDSSKPISIIDAMGRAPTNFSIHKKKNVKVTLWFLKKKRIILVNLII